MIEFKASISPISRQAIALKTLRSASRQAQALAEQSGREMVAEAQRLVSNNFESRSGDRRKAESQTHLVDSFTYEVTRGDQPGGFPYIVALIPKPDLNDDDLAKLIVHNWGRSPGKQAGYQIPLNAGQPWLKFPELETYLDEFGAPKFPQGSIRSVFWKPRNQESSGGRRFLQTARDTVAARLKRRVGGIRSPR